MKVFGRIIGKVIILLLFAALAAAGAVGWRTYQKSAPEYIMDRYLSLLISEDTEKAYDLLDQSEESPMSEEEYAAALEGKKYGLSSAYTVDELEKRVDNDGNEYVDFHAVFRNAADEVQSEEDFIVKKQAEAAFGIFDEWKVLSGHCMVKNFQITVPTGAQVYINNTPADPSWITRDGIPYSSDCYSIPSMLPGRSSLVIRHPAFDSVNTTLDTNAGPQDYCAQMALKRAAKDECKELGVTALKQLYAASVKEKTEGLEELFGACQDDAEQFVKKQGDVFHQEDHVFQNIGISDFAAQYGDPVFGEGEDSAITTEMTLSCHYLLREDVTSDTEELQEDGTPVRQTESVSDSGDITAKLVMAFRDGAWSIASMEIPVIGQENAG